MKLIDLGNPSTFPNIVMQILDKNCDVIRTKFENDRKFDELKRDGGDAEILCAQESDQNSEYDFFEQTFVDLLLQEQRLFMRVWHYTRLLECEIKEILVAIRPADTQLLQKNFLKHLRQDT